MFHTIGIWTHHHSAVGPYSLVQHQGQEPDRKQKTMHVRTTLIAYVPIPIRTYYNMYTRIILQYVHTYNMHHMYGMHVHTYAFIMKTKGLPMYGNADLAWESVSNTLRGLRTWRYVRIYMGTPYALT